MRLAGLCVFDCKSQLGRCSFLLDEHFERACARLHKIESGWHADGGRGCANHASGEVVDAGWSIDGDCAAAANGSELAVGTNGLDAGFGLVVEAQVTNLDNGACRIIKRQEAQVAFLAEIILITVSEAL